MAASSGKKRTSPPSRGSRAAAQQAREQRRSAQKQLAAVALGFYLPDGGKADIRLTLDFTDPQWTDWFLVDRRTGQRQRITHTTITLRGVESGSGQYALMKNEE